MTKEQCIGLLKRYAEYDGIGIPNLAGCKEAMRMAAELLERPSLPSNLDEAAVQAHIRMEESGEEMSFLNTFKAGAEWMAGQSQKIDGDLEKEAEAYWKAQGGGSHAQWDKFRAVVKHFTEWQQ